MGIDSSFGISEIPIGKPPSSEQIEQWKEESRLKRLSVDFVDLNEYPKFVQSIGIIKSNINRERESQNLPLIEDGWPEIRYIDRSTKGWNEIAVSAGGLREPMGGFFDRKSNVVFLSYDKETFNSGLDAKETVYELYKIAHELGHFVTPKDIENYSFHLSEGLADTHALKWIDQEVVDNFLGEGKYTIIRSEINDFLDKGIFFELPDDIVIIKDDGFALVSSRVQETRLIKHIERILGKNDFGDLLYMVNQGNIESVGNLLKLRLGEDVERLLNDPKHKNDAKEIRKLILSKEAEGLLENT